MQYYSHLLIPACYTLKVGYLDILADSYIVEFSIPTYPGLRA